MFHFVTLSITLSLIITLGMKMCLLLVQSTISLLLSLNKTSYSSAYNIHKRNIALRAKTLGARITTSSAYTITPTKVSAYSAAHTSSAKVRYQTIHIDRE